jgi:glycosyltransferase involved in cell wall biosynthesis
MKKILIVGMVDSIHLARWLCQFENSSLDFTIFPSTKFRYVHPELLKLMKSNNNFALSQKKFISLFGFKEFIYSNFLSKLSNKFAKEFRLMQLIKSRDFDYIHLLEIQGAGYLYLSLRKKFKIAAPKVILTNWGSDIYYFQNQKWHLEKIREILSFSDFYSAECQRDYNLAYDLKFRGKMLPCIPNAGGFKAEDIKLNEIESSKRNLIIVKGYEGEFGRASLVIPALEEALRKHSDLNVFFYSVSPALMKNIELLQKNFPNRINYATQKKQISRDKLRELFLKSKIYIGASVSDGLSTSFLESLAYGAFPIQTNTSCGEEMLIRGAKGELVPLDSEVITKTLMNLLEDNSQLELDRCINKKFSLDNLSYSIIKEISLGYYSIV